MDLQPTTALDPRPDLARQVRRAAELLSTAVQVLRETPRDIVVSGMADRVSKAAANLASAARNPERIGATTVEVHGLLAEAHGMGRRAGLESRQRQCLEAIARGMTLLYPIARENGLSPSGTVHPKAKDASVAPPVDERRKHHRGTLHAEVGFESDSNFYAGFTEDVSEGGLFLATIDIAPIGTEIEITFSLPDGHIVSTRGIVRWVRQPRDWADHDTTAGMGIQFRDLLPEDREAIQMFIETRQPLFYAD